MLEWFPMRHKGAAKERAIVSRRLIGEGGPVEITRTGLDSRADMERFSTEAAQKVRDYVKRQVEFWSQVPGLALIADGRSGYSDSLGRAYQMGLWTIAQVERGGYYRLFVYCQTGDLVDISKVRVGGGDDLSLEIDDSNGIHKAVRLVGDRAAIEALAYLDSLNAEDVIRRLYEYAHEEYFYAYDPVEARKDKKRWAEEYGVERVNWKFLKAKLGLAPIPESKW